jgi:hypothetical protein
MRVARAIKCVQGDVAFLVQDMLWRKAPKVHVSSVFLISVFGPFVQGEEAFLVQAIPWPKAPTVRKSQV